MRSHNGIRAAEPRTRTLIDYEDEGEIDPRSTGCDIGPMTTTISQRELRNSGGDIMRRLEAGEAFIVTREGSPWVNWVPFDASVSSVLTRLPTSFTMRPASTWVNCVTTSTPSPTRASTPVPEQRLARESLTLPSLSVLSASIRSGYRWRWRSPRSRWANSRPFRTPQPMRRNGHDVKTDCDGQKEHLMPSHSTRQRHGHTA